MKVFKKNTYWVLYFYIFTILLTFIALPFFIPENAFSYHPILIFVVGLQILVLLYIQFSRSKNTISISNESIYFKNLFNEQELRFDEINGFSRLKLEVSPTLTSHYLIVPKNKLKKNIKFNLSYKNVNELTDWLETNFKDLDQEQEDKAYTKTVNNPIFGLNPIERELTIKHSKFAANILNFIGFIIFCLIIFIANDYLAITAIIIPLIAIFTIFYFKGLIKLEFIKRTSFFKKEKNASYEQILSKNPSIFSDVFLAITLPSISLAIIAIREINVLNYSNSWLLALYIASCLFIIIVFVSKEFRFTKLLTYGKLLFIFIFLFGYGFGSTIVLNSLLDNSKPLVYHQKILNKSSRKDSKKSFFSTKSYQLNITPWLTEQKDKPQTIKVSKSLYDNLTSNEFITIQQKKGAFNIPWYKVYK